MEIGCLVESKDNAKGIGKLTANFQFDATVTYFISVGEYENQTVPLASLRRVCLRPQTRCYLWLQEEESWRTGRIFAWDQSRQEYQVELVVLHSNDQFCKLAL